MLKEYCKNCGLPLDENERFCPRCGVKRASENDSGSSEDEFYTNGEEKKGKADENGSKKTVAIVFAVIAVIVVVLCGVLIFSSAFDSFSGRNPMESHDSTMKIASVVAIGGFILGVLKLLFGGSKK